MPRPLMPSKEPRPEPESEADEATTGRSDGVSASGPVAEEQRILRPIPEPEPRREPETDDPEPSFKPVAKVPTEGGILPPPRILNRRRG